MSKGVIELDVREDLRQGRPPCTRITTAAEGLSGGQKLRLIAPFRPDPLIGLLSARGFACVPSELGGGDWAVLIGRAGEVAGRAPVASCHCSEGFEETVIEVDARGCEPPEPMRRVLQAVEALEPGGTLVAWTDRRPMFLYAQLEQRGYTAESEEAADGSIVTRIRHANG